jgi:hypothetical protein
MFGVEPRAMAFRYHDAQPHSHRACDELNVQRLTLNVNFKIGAVALLGAGSF